MKKLVAGFFALSLLMFGSFVAGKHFWRGETMTAAKAEKKWGSTPFEANLFKASSIEDKAHMAASLVKGKKYIGKTISEVRTELGSPDGYYFSDVFPAYLIQDGRTHKGEGTWQIVFIADQQQKITDVIIHKNAN